MSTIPERRFGPDRRSMSRGGRRPDDLPGFSPLVLVVDEDPHARELCEVILAKLQFAVTSAPSVEKATRILAALQPEIIVARPVDVDALRAHVAKGRHGPVPVVEVTDPGPDASVLIDAILAALRKGHARP